MKGDGELGCLCSFTPARPGGPQSLFPPPGVCFPTRAMLAVRIIAAVSPGPHPNLQQPSRDTWNSKGQHGWSSDASVLVTACSCDTKGLAKTLFLPGG